MKPGFFAIGARQLLDLRRQGKRPAGLVGVILREVPCAGLDAVLRVFDDMPAGRMDWRMLVNLDVVVLADATVPLDRVGQILGGIAKARPHRLVLRFAHTWRMQAADGGLDEYPAHDVEVGRGLHWQGVDGVPDTHEFIWLPMAHTGTPIERQLVQALAAMHQPGGAL